MKGHNVLTEAFVTDKGKIDKGGEPSMETFPGRSFPLVDPGEIFFCVCVCSVYSKWWWWGGGELQPHSLGTSLEKSALVVEMPQNAENVPDENCIRSADKRNPAKKELIFSYKTNPLFLCFTFLSKPNFKASTSNISSKSCFFFYLWQRTSKLGMGVL